MKRWLNYFPRENFLLLCAEDLWIAPDENLKKIYDFLGIESGKQHIHLCHGLFLLMFVDQSFNGDYKQLVSASRTLRPGWQAVGMAFSEFLYDVVAGDISRGVNQTLELLYAPFNAELREMFPELNCHWL